MNRWRIVALALVACVLSLTPGCSSKSTTKVGAYSPQPTDANVQPAWFIDPANSTGCATDNPSGGGTAIWGTSATCANGNGPLASWYGLNTQRWNCSSANPCPRLRQNTTITFLSSQSGNTDPVYFKPLVEAGAHVILQGALPTPVATGAAGTVTAKNRSTPTILKSTFTLTAADGGAPPTLVAGEMIVNATHASRNWLYTVGSPNGLTTPITPEIPANPAITPAEVTTWAGSDAVSFYQPVNVNLVDIEPTWGDWDQATFNNQLAIYNLTAYDPNAGGLDALTVGGNGVAQFLEVNFQRNILITSSSPSQAPTQFRNCYFASNVFTGYGAAPQFGIVNMFAGALSAGAGSLTSLGSVNLDGDIIMNAGGATIVSGNLGTVYLETSRVLEVGGQVGTTSRYNTNTPVVWGPGTLNVAGAGRLQYPAGAGKAASTLTATALQLNGQTKYFPLITSTAGGIATGNVSLTAAQLDTSFGGTSGCALGLGAMFCNAGP